MRATSAVGFVVWLILMPAVATAGPIPFLVGIGSTAQPDINGGAGNFSIVDPGNRPAETASTDGPLTLVNIRLTPRPPADPGWEQGTARPVVGITPFSIGVTFTDGLSGSDGTVHVSGAARSEWIHEGEGPFTLTGAWIDFEPVPGGLMLGVNRYSVFASGAAGTEGNLNASLTFRVDSNLELPPSPLPPPGGGVDTPEPGTMIMAGLGLFVAGGFAVRRRRS